MPDPRPGVSKCDPDSAGALDRSVLLVDDNDSVRLLLTGFLEGLGWNVTAAVSASNALAMFHACAQKPAIALLDFVLPDGSGSVLARDLRSVAPGLRVVYMSAFRTPSDADPRDPVLPKPLDLSIIAAELERAQASIPAGEAGGSR